MSLDESVDGKSEKGEKGALFVGSSIVYRTKRHCPRVGPGQLAVRSGATRVIVPCFAVPRSYLSQPSSRFGQRPIREAIDRAAIAHRK